MKKDKTEQNNDCQETTQTTTDLPTRTPNKVWQCVLLEG